MERIRRRIIIPLLVIFAAVVFAPFALAADNCIGCSCCEKECHCTPGLCAYSWLQTPLAAGSTVLCFQLSEPYSLAGNPDIYAYSPVTDIFHPPRSA